MMFGHNNFDHLQSMTSIFPRNTD